MATIVLRDVHLSASPSWWPPAPGWWIVAAIVLVLIGVPLVIAFVRNRQRRQWAQWFDDEIAHKPANAEVAAISALLRRASRRVDVHADRLQGDDWLAFLDGDKATGFSQRAGRVLLEGAFRRDVDADALAELRGIARARFMQLMAGRR